MPLSRLVVIAGSNAGSLQVCGDPEEGGSSLVPLKCYAKPWISGNDVTKCGISALFRRNVAD